jgi:hypothetical protein
VVTFMAKAESETAGVTGLEIVADPAVPGDQVALVEGPSDWEAGTSSQGGFVVGGGALPPGQDVKVTVRIKRLPDAPEIVFKVVQSYSDGRVDHWIELPGPDGADPASPAAILKLGATMHGAPAESEAVHEHEGEAAHGSLLARTGSWSRSLLGAGLLCMAGGTITLAGVRRRPFRSVA